MGLELEEFAREIVGVANEVHKTLGPGLLRSAYEDVLCCARRLRVLAFEEQLSLPTSHKGVKLDCGYRVDIVAEGEAVAETRCADELLPVHDAQPLTYVRLGGSEIGSRMDSHVTVLKQGLKGNVL